ncbi:HAD family hydrolase [Saccharibacillus qingshengii]|uniref:HAD family hydrolase n=1 Tax=Saccharibacillus qingshengii TaxID=1763540 RepID=UPI0015518951|nr:HAD family hydrolase [Saccharibacillus qingshengii]
MTIIVFDLDDTLYDEITFVYSGFREVARFLASSYSLSEDILYADMLCELEQSGRGKVFDAALQKAGIHSRENVGSCLKVYRQHVPQIELFDDARRFLDRSAPNSLYIVTDGNKLVQHRKVLALGLYDYPAIKKVYISRRFGVHNEKPSPHCFHLICAEEKVSANAVVYVGDNPAKDFVGIRPLGFRTVRIMRGNHKDVEREPHYEAEYRIHTLDELEDILIEMNMDKG